MNLTWLLAILLHLLFWLIFCFNKFSVPTDFLSDPISCWQSWFFDKITRKEAEKLLLEKYNPNGAFLVRPSESNPDTFTLSVKQIDGPTPGYLLKHYKINVDAGGYYISKTRIFPTLEALVSAYWGMLPNNVPDEWIYVVFV